MFTLNSWFLNAGNQEKRKKGMAQKRRTYLCTTLIHSSELKVPTLNKILKVQFPSFSGAEI